MSVQELSIVEEYLERAKAAEQAIPEILTNGAGFTPYDDMVLYMIIATPKLTDEEMKGVDKKTLEVLFVGDKEENLTNQKLVIVALGDKCVKAIKPGDRVAIRGNAYKITTPKGTFFTVREYDVIGKYEEAIN
jgi:hypothetical protein